MEVCPCKLNERMDDGYTRTTGKLARDKGSRLQRLTELPRRIAKRAGRRNWRAVGRAAYWLPTAGVPAFSMEEAAAKMRAAL